MSSRVDIVDFSDHHLITFISMVNQMIKRASCSSKMMLYDNVMLTASDLAAVGDFCM